MNTIHLEFSLKETRFLALALQNQIADYRHQTENNDLDDDEYADIRNDMHLLEEILDCVNLGIENYTKSP